MSAPLIVKLRRVADEPTVPWLCTDKAGSIAEYIDPARIPAGVKRALGTAIVGHFHARRDGDGRIIIGAAAGVMPW